MTILVRFATVVVSLLACAGVSFAAVGSSAGAPVQDGKYVGLVGPGYPIHFQVSANGTVVNDLVVGFDETCNGAPALTAPLFDFKSLRIEAGRFSGSTTDHFGKTVSDALHITASFDGRNVTGKVADTSAIKSLKSCTQTEPFTAKLHG